MKCVKRSAVKWWAAACVTLPVLAGNAQIDVHIGLPSIHVEAAAPAVNVAVAVPSGGIAINTEADFDTPLTAYGRWDMVDGVRVWFPGSVEASWRPYSAGHWQMTDAGWYWVSDEPFGWATYHYGRWDFREGAGWYWSPEVHWAPAWVAWRSGGGYSGWAPLPRAAGFGVHFDINVMAPHAFCFVQEGHFTDPIRPTTVVINNTTIINKTTIINETRTVNGAVIHAGPPVERIEKATGHRIEVVKATEVRARVETKVEVKPHDDAKARQVAAREQQNRGPEIKRNEAAAGAENRNRVDAQKTEARTQEENRARTVDAQKTDTRTEEQARARNEADERKVDAKDNAKNVKPKPQPKKPTPADKDKQEHPQNEHPEEKPQGQ